MQRKSFDSFMKELPRFLRFVTCTTRKKEKPQPRALAVFREKEINRGKTAVPVRKQMEQSSSQRKFFRKKRIAFLLRLSPFPTFIDVRDFPYHFLLLLEPFSLSRTIIGEKKDRFSISFQLEQLVYQGS